MKPKAVVYAPYSPTKPGASGMRTHYIIQSLEKKGFEVKFLSPPDASNVGLAQAIANESPQLVIGTSPPLPPLFFVWLGAKWSGAKFILDAKDDGKAISLLQGSNRSVKENIFLQLRRFLYTHADELWFLTQGDQREAQNNYSIATEKCKLVSNGTDPRITFSADARKRRRKEWKVKSSDRVVIYAGSMGDEDIIGYVNAASALPKNYFFIFIFSHDNSPSEQALRQTIMECISTKLSRFSVLENVPVEEMGSFFSAADVGVIPWKDFLSTSLPIKVFDYAGTGLPVLAKCSSQGELAEFLERQKEWGSSTPSWESFGIRLKKMTLNPLSDSRRRQRGKKAHNEWNRIKILETALNLF